jgi:hypothetical protein
MNNSKVGISPNFCNILDNCDEVTDNLSRISGILVFVLRLEF